MKNKHAFILAAILATAPPLSLAVAPASTPAAKPEAQSRPQAQTPKKFGFQSVQPGAGDSPSATDTVTVHYEGRLPSGQVFDSSYQRKKPASFKLSQVIPCWTEGLQMMKPGGKAKLTCPAAMAYGDAGVPGLIRGGATLIFEVELLSVTK